MSDRACAFIDIGGTIVQEATLKALCAMIHQEGMGPDWNELYDDVDQIEEDFKDARRGARCVRFFDDQARGGEFTEVEAFCRQNCIPYSRTNDSHWNEIPAGTESWAEGFEPRWTPGDNNNSHMVPLERLTEAFAAGTVGAIIDEFTPIPTPPIKLPFLDVVATIEREIRTDPSEGSDPNLRGIDLD